MSLSLSFLTKTLYAFLDYTLRATGPAHLDLRFLIMLEKNTMHVAQNYVTTNWFNHLYNTSLREESNSYKMEDH